MNEKRKIYNKKAGVVSSAILIALMLTGISVVQYQNASGLSNEEINNKLANQEEIVSPFCEIVSIGVPYVIQGISSGQFTFSELQNQIHELGGEWVTINVTATLLERLPGAQGYCEQPPRMPTGWHFNWPALCLAVSTVPIVGITCAYGAVSGFFALFGGLAETIGSAWFVLVLRGLGILDTQMLQICANIYNTCMNLGGGGNGNSSPPQLG